MNLKFKIGDCVKNTIILGTPYKLYHKNTIMLVLDMYYAVDYTENYMVSVLINDLIVDFSFQYEPFKKHEFINRVNSYFEIL